MVVHAWRLELEPGGATYWGGSGVGRIGRRRPTVLFGQTYARISMRRGKEGRSPRVQGPTRWNDFAVEDGAHRRVHESCPQFDCRCRKRPASALTPPPLNGPSVRARVAGACPNIWRVASSRAAHI